jgi:TonB family protein
MNRTCIGDRTHGFGVAGIKLFQGAALALILAMAMPVHAADERTVKSRVRPFYPEIAKHMRIAGAVQLKAKVDAEGKVTDVKAVSGNHFLAVAAEDAVKLWRFVPGAGDSNVNVEVNFTVSP